MEEIEKSIAYLSEEYTKHQKIIYFVSILVLVSVFFVVLFGIRDSLLPIILSVIALAISIPIQLYLDRQAKAFQQVLENFASANNLSRADSPDLRSLSGRLFQVGHSKTVTNLLIGSYRGFPTRVFNYTYDIGDSESPHKIYFTVCEVTVSQTKFPHIFLKSNSMIRHAGRDFYGKNTDAEISLSDTFYKSFELFCTKEYEIEVLQIFSKEILLFLQEKASHISIEFAESKIYFYDDYVMEKEEDLQRLYDVVKKVVESAGPLMQRLSDDFESIREVYEPTDL